MCYLYVIAIFVIILLAYYLYSQQTIKQGFYPYGPWYYGRYPGWRRGWGWRRGYPGYGYPWWAWHNPWW